MKLFDERLLHSSYEKPGELPRPSGQSFTLAAARYGAGDDAFDGTRLFCDESYARDYLTLADCAEGATQMRRMMKFYEDLPRTSFREMLRAMMAMRHMTLEELAFSSWVSRSTVQRLCTQDRAAYPRDQVLALIIGLQMPPWISREFLRLAGLRLENAQSLPYEFVVNVMYMCTMDEVQSYLKEQGIAPLKVKDAACSGDAE